MFLLLGLFYFTTSIFLRYIISGAWLASALIYWLAWLAWAFTWGWIERLGASDIFGYTTDLT